MPYCGVTYYCLRGQVPRLGKAVKSYRYVVSHNNACRLQKDENSRCRCVWRRLPCRNPFFGTIRTMMPYMHVSYRRRSCAAGMGYRTLLYYGGRVVPKTYTAVAAADGGRRYCSYISQVIALEKNGAEPKCSYNVYLWKNERITYDFCSGLRNESLR